jgi:hypothetical protein
VAFPAFHIEVSEVPLARATGPLAREPRFLNSSPSEPESCHTVCSHTILLLLPSHSHPLLFAASPCRRPGSRGLAPAPAITPIKPTSNSSSYWLLSSHSRRYGNADPRGPGLIPSSVLIASSVRNHTRITLAIWWPRCSSTVTSLFPPKRE